MFHFIEIGFDNFGVRTAQSINENENEHEKKKCKHTH